MSKRQIVDVEQYVSGLRALEGDYITLDRVVDYVAGRRLDDASLEHHVRFKKERYTRHLLFRDELFELMLIAWEPGQKTPAHTHNGQLGWMTVERGAIDVQEFRHQACSAPERQNVIGLDCLAGGENVQIEPGAIAHAIADGSVHTVDKIQTIHQLACPADSEERAISMHIYSRPFTSCVTFDLDERRCARRQLFWDSEYGRPLDGPTT